MSLERFCRKPLAWVAPHQTVLDAAEKMRELHVGAVVVTDDGHPVGILTDRDIVCRVVADRKSSERTPVKLVMSSDLTVAHLDDAIEEAALKMRQKGVRRLPIVGSDSRVIGLVALDDLIVLLSAELSQTAIAVRLNKGP